MNMKKRTWRFLFATSSDKNIGLLFLRLFAGAGLIAHGYSKIFAGPERWAKLGSVLSKIGIDFLHPFWGFMAAFAEFFGGIMILLGLFTTIASFLVFCTMLAAGMIHHHGDNFFKREPALLYLFISFFFMIKGAGAFSLDWIIEKFLNKK